ncbi:alpha/beta hydrolase [Coraliomargarita algicola]|uniref:Alpha/beta hydrolase n=1 Tax=Coraliomargarita algicola TaxID=3092156 RepID=A0ABZ0RMF8_9BACT|nr:alpha/beta hydrolase [Coraliomargarita sp. J2-16]WPJ96687.1 alpha/beta hydrolase [Coraliomargarita sp. J2-16]
MLKILLLILSSVPALLLAHELPLWPEGAPGALGTESQDIPTLTISLPEEGSSNGGAVVICPGGGYGGLAMNHEGHAIAKWFNAQGYAAAVLKYRLPAKGYPHPAPMQDVQRAIQTLRARTEEWQLDPERIGVFGSSAGGHLAATAATHFLAADSDAEDPVVQVSSRPDFLVMLYPVVSMDAAITHRGSRNNLLGKEPSPDLVELMSNELQVTSETPPTFIVHADDDRGVKAENSIRFYLALRANQVPAELHIFKQGGHGFGFQKQRSLPVHHWPDLLADWLKAQVSETSK